MIQSMLRIAGSFFVLVASVAVAQAQWGTLKGKFVYDGTPPESKPLNVAKEPMCMKNPPMDEKLTVAKDGGIRDIIVFVRSKDVKVNPDVAKAAKGDVVLDNKDCKFVPHVLPMTIGQTLVIKNSDPFAHNSNVTDVGGAGTNPQIQPMAQATYKYQRAKLVPQPVACNIHPWMTAYVLPRDNPYFGVSKADGTFEIKDLPVGKLEFQVWQEKAGTFKDDKSNGWTNGKFEFTIKAGDNDLGTIKLKPAVFNK
jgi:hypothetical protein